MSCVGVVPPPHTAVLLEYVDGLVELGCPPSFASVTRDVFVPGTRLSAAAVLEIGLRVRAAYCASALRVTIRSLTAVARARSPYS